MVLGLVGGRSVSGVYKKLARESVNWKNVHMFMVDERFVPLFSKESNASGKVHFKYSDFHPLKDAT